MNRNLASATPSFVALLACFLAGCAGDDDPSAGDASSSSTADSAPAQPSTSAAPSVAEPTLEGRYPVTEDGRELALTCWGQGAPAVLLETGGTNIEEWTGSGLLLVLAENSRVCTYDRAGTGESDAAPDRRRDADDVVTEASAVLAAAGVKGPFVLVGRSFGGMIVTHFAATMPSEVRGVVVLDTPAPSAEFTEESEPELVWDAPGNTEHLDVVGGFENRFAHDPPRLKAPLLLVTPDDGEASARNEAFWLQTSPDSRQVTCAGEPDAGGPCADQIVAFVERLTRGS